MIELFSTIGLSAAVIAGVVTVFLPCTYPMVVGYIALLIGDDRDRSIMGVLKVTGWFFVGFGLTYSFFGSAAGFFGQFSQTTLFFNSIKPLLTAIGGGFFILVGLVLLQAIPLPKRLRSMYSLRLPQSFSVHSWWGSAGTGAIFAAAWSPCLGPVLGGILLLAASSGSALTGSLLLFAFSVGMALPMLTIAVLYRCAAQHLKKWEKIIPIARVIGGLLFILLGIAFFAGDFSFLGNITFSFLERYI